MTAKNVSLRMMGRPMPRPQFSLRALFLLTMLVAVVTLPSARLVNAFRAWLSEEAVLKLTLSATAPVVTIDINEPPVLASPIDNMPILVPPQTPIDNMPILVPPPIDNMPILRPWPGGTP